MHESEVASGDTLWSTCFGLLSTLACIVVNSSFSGMVHFFFTKIMMRSEETTQLFACAPKLEKISGRRQFRIQAFSGSPPPIKLVPWRSVQNRRNRFRSIASEFDRRAELSGVREHACCVTVTV